MAEVGMLSTMDSAQRANIAVRQFFMVHRLLALIGKTTAMNLAYT
jgi:hypothetical protein